MKITIEIDSKSELERLSAFFKTFQINTVNVISSDDASLQISKGDKKIDPTDLFKIWEEQPRTLEEIRKNSWRRNHSGE